MHRNYSRHNISTHKGLIKDINPDPKARFTIGTVNTLGGILGILLIFNAIPIVLIPLGVLYPIIIAVIFYRHRSVATFEDSKTGKSPTFILGMMMVCLGLGARAFVGYKIFSYEEWLAPCAVCFLALLILFFWLLNEQGATQRRKSNYGTLLFSLLIYSAATPILLNCYADFAAPQVYTATITNKHTISGKSVSYYVTLTTWGPQTKADDYDIGENWYSTLHVGDRMYVSLHPGLLHIRWYTIAK